MALALAAGGMAGAAHAQHAFSSAWFANKGAMQNTATATGRLPNGMPASSLTSPQAQQQRANEQLSRSINNLNLAARGIAAQQAAQAAARLAAGNDPSVPDGLADGGLKVDTNSLTAGWLNANAPVQSQVDGRTRRSSTGRPSTSGAIPRSTSSRTRAGRCSTRSTTRRRGLRRSRARSRPTARC
jgi:hypothetical protein